ncbi:MAG: tail-specific protease [bacterium]|nr:tail-specific protease [bacterium]
MLDRLMAGKKIDNDFSQKALDEFLEVLDSNKRFLLQGDIQELRRYKNRVDDQFADGSTELMQFATSRIRKRIRQVQGFYEELLAKPFDFTLDERFELNADNRGHPADMAEMKELWRKIAKYRALIRFINLKKAEDKTPTGKTDAQLEEKARKALAKSFKNIFDRLLQTYEKDALSLYLNSLVQVYDPHTVYFPPTDKETFEMRMSGSFEGIGALLGEKDGYVNVARIIPGGPSWKQKQLQPGDAILKVGQGNKEPEDIVGMRVQDAVKLIRGKKGTLVKLTIKRPEGDIVVIPILRDVVVLEETFARSAVLTDMEGNAAGKKIGYIYLPGFYTDFNEKNGRNSTDDIRKELEKLIAKKVDGVILDLRNNSGGALQDAVRMSGLFIPEGPVVQVKDHRVGTRVLEDTDPETIYSGPLIVMVNTLSASASEILAAALQDYGRAVIVGSNQSFGKGTVQAMLNLDRYLNRKPGDDTKLGALTLTIQKFYRINGNSIQQKGVIPDVILPDRYSAIDIGERYLDHSLSWDTIPSADFTKWPHHPVDRRGLAEKSGKRIQENHRFQLLNKYIQILKKMQDKTYQSLQFDQVRAQQEKARKEREKYKKAEEHSCHINVTPSLEIVKKPSSSMKAEQTEELFKIEKDREKEWFKQIEKDMLLKETMAVMKDMIESRT